MQFLFQTERKVGRQGVEALRLDERNMYYTDLIYYPPAVPKLSGRIDSNRSAANASLKSFASSLVSSSRRLHPSP